MRQISPMLMPLAPVQLSMGGKMVFDISTRRHLHLYNTMEDSLIDYPDEELMRRIDELFAGKRFRGFKVEGIEVNILVHPTRHRKKV